MNATYKATAGQRDAKPQIPAQECPAAVLEGNLIDLADDTPCSAPPAPQKAAAATHYTALLASALQDRLFVTEPSSLRNISPAAEEFSATNAKIRAHGKDKSFIEQRVSPAESEEPAVAQTSSYQNAIASSSATRSNQGLLEPVAKPTSTPAQPQERSPLMPPVAHANTLDRQIQKERMAVASPATVRKCQIAHVFFLDYYFDLLTYLHQRKLRTQAFKEDARERQLSNDAYQREWKHYCGKERAFLRKRRRRTNAEHFQLMAQVGQGGYGQVFLACKKDTNEVCALKKISKGLLQKLGEVQHVLTERDILTFSQSEWLVKLLYAFQDPEHVFLAMEFVPGGDMRTLLNNSGVLREEPARFYIAEMVVAVDALHQLGYLHRDLKPENFLIDSTGHIKLTDFGLSKGALSPHRVASLRSKLELAAHSRTIVHRTMAERRSIHQAFIERNCNNAGTPANTTAAAARTWAYSLVGSPDYVAPEILASKGYDMAADYWGLGCILFEFLAGYPPFTAPTMEEVWLNIYQWEKVLERPVYKGEDAEFNLSDDAWDLITKLITHRDRRFYRLADVEAHVFFARAPTPITNFAGLRQPKHLGGIDPPFVPQLASPVDTSYFDDFNDPRDMEIYKEVQARKDELSNAVESASPSSPGGRRDFVGFTFKHRFTRRYPASG